MRISKPLTIALLVMAAQLSALSAELAMLQNGRSIRHERHEQIGANTRLYTSEGYIDVATESVASASAALWSGGPVVGTSNHTNFIKASRSGKLTARSTPMRREP